MELREKKKIYYVLLVPNNLKLSIDCSISKYMYQEIEELKIIKNLHLLLYSYTIPEYSNDKIISFKYQSNNYSFSSQEIKIDPHKNNFLFNIIFKNENFFLPFWRGKKEFNPQEIAKSTMYYSFQEYVINLCKNEKKKESLNSDLLKAIISEMLTWKEIEIEFYLDLIFNVKTNKDLYTLLFTFSLDKITFSKQTERLEQLVLNAISLINNKILTDNFLSEYEGDKKQKLEKCTNEFILSIYNLNPTELENYIMSHNNIASIIPVIVHQKFTEVKLSKEIIFVLLKECNTRDEFISLLTKTKNINDLLDIIKNNEELFEQYGDESEEEELDIKKISYRKKEDNISLVLQDMLEIYKMKEKNEKLKYIKIEPFLLYDYIDFFESDLDKLNEIRKEAEVINIQMNKNLVEFIHRLNFYYHKSGLELIDRRLLQNNEVLDFVINDYFYYNKDVKYSAKKIDIYKGINLETIDEKFKRKYKEINFHNIFDKSDYKQFISNIFKTINTFETLSKVLDFHQINEIVIDCLYSRFEYLFISNQKVKIGTLIKIITFFLSVFEDDYYKANSMIEYLLKHLTQGILYDIFIAVIDKVKHQEIISKMINTLLDNFGFGKNQNIFNLVKSIKNKSILIELFNKLNYYCFNENDLFSLENTIKLQFLKDLYYNNYFTEEYGFISGTEYMKKTKETLQDIGTKLGENQIKENELIQLILIPEKELKERLELIYSLNKEKAIEIYNKLNDTYNTIKQLRNTIKILIEYESTYNPYSDRLRELQNFNNEINSISLSDIEKNKDIINYINNTKDEAITYNILSKSKFFESILDYYKSKNPNDKDNNRIKAKETFSSLSNLLDANTIKEVSKNILKIIFEQVNNFELFHREIEFLKSYFDKKDVNTEEIEDNLLIIAYREKIITLFNSMLFLIGDYKIKQTDYSKQLEEILTLLNAENIDNVLIKNKCDAIGYNCRDKSKHYDIICKIYKKNNFLPFVRNKKEEEIRNLIEFIDEIDGAFISPADVQDLVKVIVFFNDIQNQSINKVDKDFINLIKTLSNDNTKYNNIEVYIENVNNNLSELSDLYLKTVNKNEFSKQKIISLYTSSFFIITLHEGKIICDISYGNKKISLEDCLELKDRILLKKNEKNSEEAVEFLNKSLEFSKILTQIENITVYLENLSLKGYPKNKKFEIHIENNIVNVKDYPSLSQVNKELKEKYEKLTDLQISYYEANQMMTFLNGRQFFYMNQFIQNSKGNINNILRYIFGKRIKINEDYHYGNLIDTDESEEMLYNIGNFLKSNLETNKMSIDDIFSPSNIKDMNYNGIYSIKVFQDSLEKDIINWYHFLTGNQPIAQTILFCNLSTTSEELVAFLIRALYCKSHTLFSLVKIELLDLEKRHLILEMLNEFFIHKKNQMNSSLFIFFTDRNSDIIDQLTKMNYHKHLDNGIIKEHYSFSDNNIEIVCADSPGVGKSNYIK